MEIPVYLYLDLDDVVCETAQALLQIAQSRGAITKFEELTSFESNDVFGFSDETWKEVFSELHSKAVLEQLSPVEGAISGIKRLLQHGIEIAFVTGRPSKSHLSTERWLDSYGLADILVTYVDKYNRGTSTHSWDDLSFEKYFLAVEDSHRAARRISEMAIPVLLFDRPWNRAVSVHSLGNVSRVSSWQEIVQHTMVFAEKRILK